QQRLSGVGDEARQVLEAAAVAGREFSLRALRRSSGRSESELVRAISVLRGTGLIEATPEGSYRFSHAFGQEVVASSLDSARRTLLHLRVARALEAERARASSAELAYHYWQGRELWEEEDRERALAHLLAAGDAYHLAGQFDAAVQCYRHTQQEAAAGSPQHVETLRRLARTLDHWGEFREALEVLEQAEAALDPGDLLARAGLWAARAHLHPRLGELGRSEELCHQALQLLDQIDNGEARAERANIYNTLGYVAFLRGDYHIAAQEYRQALELRVAVGDQRRIAESYNNLGNAYDVQGDPQAESYYRQALALQERSGDKPGLSRTLKNLGNFYWRRRRFSDAIATYTRALELDQSMQNRLEAAAGYNNLGAVYFLQGDYARARENYQHFLEEAERAGSRADLALALLNLGEVSHRLGEDQAALEHLERALAILQEVGDRRDLADCHLHLGRVCHRLGRSQAKTHLKSALALAQELNVPAVSVPALDLLVALALEAGDRLEAKAWAERCQELAETSDDSIVQGISSRTQGRLARPDAARKHLEKSIALLKPAPGGEAELEVSREQLKKLGR
ncbi:MAG: tetratricopeptide repeat protein, partial [Deinococcus sp.]|nr:tetratricopeptide repeat protein [Deinococcus sp.]